MLAERDLGDWELGEWELGEGRLAAQGVGWAGRSGRMFRVCG